MLCEFKRSTEKVGLRTHPGKTKILSNQSSDTRKEIETDDIKVEIMAREESTKYLGQMITFQQQETTEIRNRIRAARASFHKYRQELKSRNYLLKHRLRLFDAEVTPTMSCASGTWTPTKEHERMIQSTQRKMLQLIMQTKRRYKKIVKRKDETNEEKDNNDLDITGDESEDGQSSTTHNDQDSDVSFENDTDEEIDTTVIEEEDWMEYIKRSTDDALEKMENTESSSQINQTWINTAKDRVRWTLLEDKYTMMIDDAMCKERRWERHQETHHANKRLPRSTKC